MLKTSDCVDERESDREPSSMLPPHSSILILCYLRILTTYFHRRRRSVTDLRACVFMQLAWQAVSRVLVFAVRTTHLSPLGLGRPGASSHVLPDRTAETRKLY